MNLFLLQRRCLCAYSFILTAIRARQDPVIVTRTFPSNPKFTSFARQKKRRSTCWSWIESGSDCNIDRPGVRPLHFVADLLDWTFNESGFGDIEHTVFYPGLEKVREPWEKNGMLIDINHITLLKIWVLCYYISDWRAGTTYWHAQLRNKELLARILHSIQINRVL